MRNINDDVTILGTLTVDKVGGLFIAEMTKRLQSDLTPIMETIAVLTQRVNELQTQIDELKGVNAELEQQINKNIIL